MDQSRVEIALAMVREKRAAEFFRSVRAEVEKTSTKRPLRLLRAAVGFQRGKRCVSAGSSSGRSCQSSSGISRWRGMGKFYERIVRPGLFRQDAEHAHERAVSALALLGALPPLCRALERWARSAVGRPVEAFGLKFPNAVGLAAGFDKNARAWPAAAALGFGHVEIGTVTALAQPGNPAPRMFRYPPYEAVINRMGFNNEGAAAVAARLARQPGRGSRRIPLGINLGKSKATAIEHAAADYYASFNALAEHADYAVLNVSS